MNVGSLFSGVGGLDLGLQRAGFRHLFLCESVEHRRSILAHHFPHIPVHHDVREVAESARSGGLRALGTVGDGPHSGRPGAWASDGDTSLDLLCGGFPCQDISIAGKRAGLAGERSGLFFEFASIVESLRPRWFLLENVPGLLSSNGGRDFGAVIGEMADLGYGMGWRILDSRYFGVPQRRRRVFILGTVADGDPRAAGELASEVLGVGERCRRHPATSGEEGEGDRVPTPPRGAARNSRPGDAYYVEGAENATLRANGVGGSRTDKQPLVVSPLASGPGGGVRMDADTLSQLVPVVSPAVTSKWAKGSGGPSGDEAQNLVVTGNVYPAGRGQSADLEVVETDLSPALDSTRNERGIIVGEVRAVSENQRGELRETEIAMQLVTGGGKPGTGYSAVREGLSVRRLTPRECERLQGFPDEWTNPDGKVADTNRYAGVGDAVTVNVAQWIGERLVSAEAFRL